MMVLFLKIAIFTILVPSGDSTPRMASGVSLPIDSYATFRKRSGETFSYSNFASSKLCLVPVGFLSC